MGIIDSITPKIVYEGTSDINKDIKVIKYGNTVKLIVNGFVQSFNESSRFAKNKVWGQMAKIILANKNNAKNVLILGMGGGTMLHMLEKQLNEATFTAVEIDPVIIELGKRYFEINKLKRTTIINADAFSVISQPEKHELSTTFDCIVVDTYIGGDLPNNMNSDVMLDKLLYLANSGALLVLNRIIYKNDKTTFNAFMSELEAMLNNVGYKRIKYPSIADNYIFFGTKP